MSDKIFVVVGDQKYEVGFIFGWDPAHPECRELVGMMVKDWAEGLLDRDDE